MQMTTMQDNTPDAPKRGRPPKGEATQRRRKQRTSETQGRKLAVPASLTDFNKFVYRWVNDDGVRMFALTQEDDWELAPKSAEIPEVVESEDAFRRVVGRNADGSPMFAYLCRKLKTFYDEDQKAKQVDLDEQLAQMLRGKARDGTEQGDYVPNAGIKIG